MFGDFVEAHGIDEIHSLAKVPQGVPLDDITPL